AAHLLELGGGALRIVLRAGARGLDLARFRERRAGDVRRKPLLGIGQAIEQLVEGLQRAAELGVGCLDAALQLRGIADPGAVAIARAAHVPGERVARRGRLALESLALAAAASDLARADEVRLGGAAGRRVG